MRVGKRFWLALLAVKELGLEPLVNYGWYQLGIRTGLIEQASRKAFRQAGEETKGVKFQPLFKLPGLQLLSSILGDAKNSLLAEADEICRGNIRIFGWQQIELDYRKGKSVKWFTQLESSDSSNQTGEEDWKFLWEPARFGWIYPLARAYHLMPDERYAEFYWRSIETFLEYHPPYYGGQWLSGQEVALRLIAWVFGYHVFQKASASTEERQLKLLSALAFHAARLPCTIHYARAQKNNHLLSEAVGLMTAATVLREHPQSQLWWEKGWKWFLDGIRSQIAEDGTYIQHSVNYHRLLLQLTLWARLIVQCRGMTFPEDVMQRLAKATRWLWECCDSRSGKVPNLGPNDGAYIQPLCQTTFEDYRAVIQAACRAYLERAVFPIGLWDEMSVWYGVWRDFSDDIESSEKGGIYPETEQRVVYKSSWVILRSKDRTTWAALRCPHFFSRPTHADLLHFDLWWKGINLAIDAGTYRYTASPPWDNPLAEAFYHNTLTVDGRNPMIKAGRFLWLGWANTKILFDRETDEGDLTVEAEHRGYHSLGLCYRRKVTLKDERIWIVKDQISATHLQKHQSPHAVRLHWLIPPFEWQVAEDVHGWSIRFEVGSQYFSLRLHAPKGSRLRIIKAGEVVFGDWKDAPTYGYTSPTYNLLQPALSIIVELNQKPPINLETVWELPQSEYV